MATDAATALATYEAEQQKLRNEHGGSGEEEDDKYFTLPKLPEINPEVFKDVEPLLYRGFLIQPAEINGVTFVFKSLNHHEFEMLTILNPGTNFSSVQSFYDLFLGYGVFLVDGVNVLVDRDKLLHDLKDTFHAFPKGMKQKVIRQLSEINRRASQATLLAEAYFIETKSRLRWAQLRNTDLTSTAVTGISGTPQLGMNWAQLTWRALNFFEDQKTQAEGEWENAKFIASSMAGKGMSKIHAQDRNRRKKEHEEKLERRDQIIRLALLGKDDSIRTKDGQVIKVASTVEELAAQLRNDLSGEKDYHDRVVEAHEARVRDEYQDRSRRIEELAARHAEEANNRSVYGSTEGFSKGLTRAEVDERITRSRQIAAQKLAGQQVFPEMDDKMGRFAQKWSLLESGGREVEVSSGKTSKDTSTAVTIPVVRPTGQPWNAKRGG
jgi:hypothetical protein